MLIIVLIEVLKSFEQQLHDCKQNSCGEKKIMLLIQLFVNPKMLMTKSDVFISDVNNNRPVSMTQ